MNGTKDPDLVDVVEAGTELFEKLAERDHLMDQHRRNGERVQFKDCTNEPCRTWHRFLGVWLRFQAGRLP